MNNKNIFGNIISVLIAIIVLFAAFGIVRSVDILRFRLEKISEQISAISGKLENLQKSIEKLDKIAASAPTTEKTANFATAEIANRQYYDQNAESGGRIITAISAETKNMNYIINNESLVSTIWEYCFDSLTERNYEHLEIFEPKLAESWSLSDDKMTYTIKLRKGALWHDFTDPVTGKKWENVEVTAHDFKFYLDVIKNEDVDCAPSRSYLIDLDRIEVISDYEFKVVWSKPYFLSESVTLGLQPLPRHLYYAYDGPFDGKKFNDDHERNRIVVGCGPYKFEKWEKDQRIFLTKWEKYYGAKYGIMPPIDNIVLEVIKLPNTQLQALMSKKIDRMGFQPEQWVKRTDGPEFDEKTGFLRKYKYPGRTYSYIGYNFNNLLFQDKRVRQALTHLVDREKILNTVFYGLGRITSGPFFMDSPYYDQDIKPYPFSVDTAKKLLDEAGWKDTDNDGILDKDGKKFEFTILSVTSSEIQQRMLPIIKEDMGKAGIVMNIVPVEWSVYVQRLEQKSFEVCTLGWAMGFENDPYQLWHSKEADQPASSNHISFRNKEADRLIEEIRVCFDLEKRIALCHEFHKLLHEEQPYTFLITPYSLIGQSARYQNVRVFPGGIETRIMWTPKKLQLPIPQ